MWRLQHGEAEGLDPSVTIVMIGTNNTGHRQDPPQCVERGISNILEEIKERLPDTRIVLLAIFPRGETPDDSYRKINNEINKRIELIADGHRVYFLDINDMFVDDEGYLLMNLMPDALHPNEQGYRVWAEAMQETLERLLHN